MKLYKNEEWLREQFCEKKRLARDIGKDFDISDGAIYKWIEKFGIKRDRPIMSKRYANRYLLNENYFEKIEDERRAYWLGFLAADGCIMNTPGRRFLSIELSQKDEVHLLKLKDDLEYSGPLHYKKPRKCGGPSVCLKVCSPKIVDNLIKNGVVERKSLVLEPPLFLEKDLVRHWIRGLFDGDGSVSHSKDGYVRGEFFGTENVMKFVVENVPGTKTVSKKKNCNGFSHCFLANEKMYNYLYLGSGIYLSRKEEIFRLVLKNKKEALL